MKNCRLWPENPCVHNADEIRCESCDIQHYVSEIAHGELEQAALELAECVDHIDPKDEICLLVRNVVTAEDNFDYRLRRLVNAARAKRKVEEFT